MKEHKNPFPTVDIIIEITRKDGERGIILIERKNPPFGWAIPGGFVDYGETLEQAAEREAREETSLDVRLKRQMHSYSEPDRDPRHHTLQPHESQRRSRSGGPAACSCRRMVSRPSGELAEYVPPGAGPPEPPRQSATSEQQAMCVSPIQLLWCECPSVLRPSGSRSFLKVLIYWTMPTCYHSLQPRRSVACDRGGSG